MRIALLVVTLASVAGPAIAPEAYLSPQSQTPSPSPIPEATPSENIPSVLYHYTSHEGLAGIMATQMILPSLGSGPNAYFGEGVYFTDISPAQAAATSPYQLSRALTISPWNNEKMMAFVAVDVSGLAIFKYLWSRINLPLSQCGTIGHQRTLDFVQSSSLSQPKTMRRERSAYDKAQITME